MENLNSQSNLSTIDGNQLKELLLRKAPDERKKILDQIYYGYNKGTTKVTIINERQKDDGNNIDVEISSKVVIDGEERNVSLALFFFLGHEDQRPSEKDYIKAKLHEYLETPYKENTIVDVANLIKTKAIGLISNK